MAAVLRVKCHRLLSCIFLACILLLIVDYSGLFRHLQEKSYQIEFSYPLETPNFIELVQRFRSGDPVDVQPINRLYESIIINSDSVDKCSDDNILPILVLVKSAPSHRKNRDAIRETWKVSTLENNGKLLFFIGNPSSKDSNNNELLLDSIKTESRHFRDIVQLEFQDSYYNNTRKTMVEMRWAVEECSNFGHALFVDDDYFVSIKNLLQFIKNPKKYPNTELLDENKGKLYAGYRMFPPPHRHKIFTKWYMPLEEYPYDYFPPYITAGAILLSQNALLDIYYASFYTAHFRFDDVYVALCAKKMNISPLHSEYFRFWSTRDESPEQYLIASHGYSNPTRLQRYWNIQKSHGFC